MNTLLVNSENTFLYEAQRIHVSIETERRGFIEKIQHSLNPCNVSYEQPKKFGWDLTGWINTYIISPIDERDKYSSWYFDCTGIVCSGISKYTDKKVSFLSHQDPLKILYKYKSDFSEALYMRLKQMMEISYAWTIDIGIFGWNIKNKDIYVFDYTEAIKLIRDTVEKILGNNLGNNIEALIGPSNSSEDEDTHIFANNATDFYYDNWISVLFSYKPSQVKSSTNISFPASEVYDVLWSMR